MRKTPKIAVDMTPARNGGENGGAKLLAVQLVEKLSEDPLEGFEIVVLTAPWNHEELSFLDSRKVSRILVRTSDDLDFVSGGGAPRKSFLLPDALRRFLARRDFAFLSEVSAFRRPPNRHRVDLLFCPFTSTHNSIRGVPIVSIVHDLQHRDLPHFFTQEEISNRDSFLNRLKTDAAHIVCVSENVRESVAKHLGISEEKITSIPNCIHGRLKPTEAQISGTTPESLGLSGRPFLFYPANFWPHKNHRMLLAAFAMFARRNPDRPLDLVFTGALEDAQRGLKTAARRMGLEDRVRFLGYLPEERLAAVWREAFALIFPSLYEGFGIPLLEAMHFGKPVLCSHTTSLPEVAANAALYFDPKKPGEICDRMERIVADQDLRRKLVDAGRENLGRFDPEEMVDRYRSVFDDVLNGFSGISGVYEDGWTTGSIRVEAAPSKERRVVEMEFELPGYVPVDCVLIRVKGLSGFFRKWKVEPGGAVRVAVDLKKNRKAVELRVANLFQPRACDLGEDERRLGALLKDWRIRDVVADGSDGLR